MTDDNSMNPITEDDIAQFLANTPDFFERHAELLATVHLTSPHGGRAVSLQERQAELLRDKIRALEQRIMEMVRHGNENMVIADRILRWSRTLFLTTAARELPRVLTEGLAAEFMVPEVALRMWDVSPQFVNEPFAADVSPEARSFASSLTHPYCGVNNDFEAVKWLPNPEAALSVALVPLRPGPATGAAPAFAMLVLASPDPQRFQSDMATDFLERIAELAAAALSRLRPL